MNSAVETQESSQQETAVRRYTYDELITELPETNEPVVRTVSIIFGTRLAAIALSGIVLCLSALAAETPRVIDDCRYRDDAAARAAWHAMYGTAPVTVGTVDGTPALHLHCNFAGTKIERACWDRRVELDLTDCRGVQFELFCRDASPVSRFHLSLQSGEGWYNAIFYPQVSGWNTITINKANATIEGHPAGWGTIKTLRLSAWRGADTDTDLYLRDIRQSGVRGVDTLIGLVRCDSAAQSQPGEKASVQRYTASLARRFEELNVSYVTLSDVELTSHQLHGLKLVVLPFNPVMPDRAVDELVAYLNSGGRLLAFSGMPARLRPLVNIDSRGSAKPDHPGGFASMRFAEDSLPGAPAVVAQNSSNIDDLKPVPGASREIAQWLDDQGHPTGRAAVVASSNAVEMSHVLLDDDAVNKRRMLLAMAGYLVPEIWQQSADASLAHVGRIAGFRDFDEAEKQIRQASSNTSRVKHLLGEARDLRETARKFRGESRFPEAGDRADQAAQRTLEAFYAAQQPVPGEFRAFWCNKAYGVEGLSWDAAIQRLADNGFTAIIPNMLRGGVAYYPSEVLPVAPEVAAKGDAVAQCLAACRKHGLQVHVWKVNWSLGPAPQDFVERMRREGRLQADARGKEELWLCPSHPDNQKLEIDSMVEIARRYKVDGLHFDCIRYPDAAHCFCAGCKDRFARALAALTNSNSDSGLKDSSLAPRPSPLSGWPQDVLPGGPQRQAWLDWRRGNITRVVKAVSEQARAINPKIKLSAAVFPNWPVDRDNVGQDWKLWCEKGYLDFVCPMDYTASDTQFENWVKHQKAWAGTTPCYPGIGAWLLTPDRIISQIQAARRLGNQGFTIFNYNAAVAEELVPLLGLGATKKSR